MQLDLLSFSKTLNAHLISRSLHGWGPLEIALENGWEEGERERKREKENHIKGVTQYFKQIH